MEFLVQIEIGLPPDMDPDRVTALRAAETEYAGRLQADGVIERIWRVPGRTASIGIWVADDATALHEAIAGLPLFPWIDVTVTALATHPLEHRPADGAE